LQDEEFVDGAMDGEAIQVGKYASSLRKYLFSEHLGILSYNDSPCDSGDWTTSSDIDITDPISDKFYNDVWVSTSRNNTQIYEEVLKILSFQFFFFFVRFATFYIFFFFLGLPLFAFR
jgi:phospholipase D1/2